MSAAHQASTVGHNHADLLDALIATYRELNLKVRPLPESQLVARHGNTSIKDLVRTMRNDELEFARLIKSELMGGTSDQHSDDVPVTGFETDDDSTAMLISQFGTARATTLSMLKDRDDAGWHQQIAGAEDVVTRTRDVIARDKRLLDQILLMKQA